MRILIHNAAIYKVNVLTVGKYRDIEFCCDLHRLPVKFGIHNGSAIFTDRRNSRFVHAPDIC